MITPRDAIKAKNIRSDFLVLNNLNNNDQCIDSDYLDINNTSGNDEDFLLEGQNK